MTCVVSVVAVSLLHGAGQGEHHQAPPVGCQVLLADVPYVVAIEAARLVVEDRLADVASARLPQCDIREVDWDG
jgi:hypothetical protein